MARASLAVSASRRRASPTRRSTVSRAWRTTLPMPFRSTKRSRLGRASCSSGGRAIALEGREQVVEHHVEPEPGGIGAELLARQRLGRQLVGQHVMRVLDRARLAALPADQIEPRAAVRIGPVGDDREVLDLAAVGEQPALLLADPADQIARRCRPVLGGHPVARHVGHLGPMPDRIAVLPLDLPGMVGQRADRRRQLAAHVGADAVAEAARLQPAQQLVLVGGAVGADQDLVDAWRQRRHGALHQTPVAGAGGHVAVPELVGQHHVLLGPERHHRLIAGPAVVGPARGPLLALENGGIDIDRRHRLRPPLLEKADQPATGLRQPLQPLAFALQPGRSRPARAAAPPRRTPRGSRARSAAPAGRARAAVPAPHRRAAPSDRHSARRRRPTG